MKDILTACFGCLVVLVVWSACGAVSAWLIEWAWNIIVPALFHGPSITYLQACAGYIVLSIIGGAFRTAASERS